MYRHPNVASNHFIEKLNLLLLSLNKENKHIFITGDFNYDTSQAIINSENNINNFNNVF